jgi:hypothetical protein
MTQSMIRVVRVLRRVARSTEFYPLSLTWAIGMSLTAAVSARLIRADVGIALFTLIIALLLSATHREVGTIHTLVNAQHDDLIRTINRMSTRIGQLLNALHRAGVQVPDVEDTPDPNQTQNVSDTPEGSHDE